MSPVWLLGVYALAIAGAAMAAAALPVIFPGLRSRTPVWLSFSAGAMLGAAFFHMLPEAGDYAVSWALVGFVFLYLLERYVLVHWCKEEEDCEVHGGHSHGTVGLAAFVGLSIHTLTDGFALGAGLEAGVGTSVFLAILFHKLPNSFSLSTILLHERYAARRTLIMAALFAATLPLGSLIYYLLSGLVDQETFGPKALAFSAGSFLHLAVSDLIPDLHRHKGDRLQLSIALLAGIALLWLLNFVGPGHSH